ncbi:zinc finger CCCH domain-containing protein 37 isoform X2 [Cornus florida]|uniref:zinc finger CCCH domain-containing protein 37 isoform X2 n=1 Tax=Cornus florida TaxID=4283 RepID=UPI002899BD63|nr:zinc finger CCCH domain-containing protein 37 isoform X2 [Cornus florida]
MANQLYGYNPSSYGGGANLSSVYSSRSLTDPYLPTDSSLSRYLSSNPSSYSGISGSSMLFNQSDSLRYSTADLGGAYSASARVGTPATASASWATVDVSDPLAGIKRPSEVALYHQTLLGAHNAIGQSEGWYSTNPLVKRPRFESASNLPIYPQRPGEKDCAHYMLTRTCKFGDSCKFDHPIWVPEGGIPDWKEVPLIPSEILPDRPGEPDCPYFLKTQRCKFGLRCKFNHPKDKILSLGALENADVSVLPERPSEPPCAFYMKTGNCKFGATCRFHHPKDIQIPAAGQENGNSVQTELAANSDAYGVKQLFTPALLHNTKGLPVRPGEVDCPFYLKTGSCKYGATCRYNHPERTVFNPTAAAIGPAYVASPSAHLNIGVVNPASILQTIDPRLTQTTLGLGLSILPQRPGQIECDFYMKTGECKFGERCKYHHPLDRSTPALATKEAQQQNIKLTPAGLPRREGAIICPYYLKTGTCKYGPTCKFDHPPPGEVMAMATSQGTSMSIEGEGKEDEKEEA